MLMKTVSQFLKVAVCIAAIALSGCSCMTNLEKGAAAGGAVGAGAGAIAGGGEGALIGAGAGAVTGALIGADLDIRDLRKQLREKDNEIAQLKAKDEDQDKRLKDLEQAKPAGAPEKGLEGVAKMEKTAKGLEMTILGETLFKSGSADLLPGASKTLDGIAKLIKEKYADKDIDIEGHTDSDPIKHSKWPSNWELGKARALTVLHYFEKQGLTSAKLSATTFGEFRPVASNATPEGKKQNRRVVVVVLNQPNDAQANQPKK